MTIAESILPEFEIEMAGTRKVLERIPDDKLDWKAHSKSNTIGWVAKHLTEIASWTASILAHDSFDINPKDCEAYKPPQLNTTQEILDQFDKYVEESKQLIQQTPDEEFGKPWSLLNAGEPLFTMPKLAVIRTWVLNHTIHHRAYLCSYLRLNDIPVPGLYGPSGDEQQEL
ncbi:DinB family protein [Gimesia fumaroli]|uniref:DinB superfamily protein n=1 Tax=Gimesia fumaroli TaxID=2527976 RepID=A0A518IHH6_9PLAN|nr:DinB family protein [Gimesia fumaroli]QDV52543.1 DinB superfamily protein [Gimesia fumaroli]